MAIKSLSFLRAFSLAKERRDKGEREERVEREEREGRERGEKEEKGERNRREREKKIFDCVRKWLFLILSRPWALLFIEFLEKIHHSH